MTGDPEYKAFCGACGHDPWHGAAMCGRAVAVQTDLVLTDLEPIGSVYQTANPDSPHDRAVLTFPCACRGADA